MAKENTMHLDLKQFDDKSWDEAEQLLAGLGYQRHPRSAKTHESVVFIKDGADHMIRLSNCPKIAARFAQLCADKKDNPFLPEVYDHRTSGDDLHITVLEPLKKETDLGQTKNDNAFKQRWMRGYASLATGHFATAADDKCGSHDTMHAMVFNESPELVEALKALTDCIEEMLQGDGTHALYNDSRKSLWFRPAEGGNKFVLFESLTATDDIKEARQQWRIIVRRLYNDLPKKTKAFAASVKSGPAEP